MAVTLAIDLGSTKGHAQAFNGNVKLTNGGSSTVTIQGLTGGLTSSNGSVKPVSLPLPVSPATAVSTPAAPLYGAGVGALPSTAPSLKLPAGYPLAAGGTLSVGFTVDARNGTLAIQAFTSDNSNPSATAALNS